MPQLELFPERRLDAQGVPVLDSAHVPVKLLALPRTGKNAALNAAARQAKGDILVITDRDAVPASDAAAHLLRPFACAAVGAVCGFLQVKSDKAQAQQQYWKGEARIKYEESRRLGNLTASNGSLLALRKKCFPHFPDGAADDMYAMLHVRSLGYQSVFAPEAVVTSSPRKLLPLEVMRRQRRVVGRGLRSLFLHRHLLNPQKHGAFALVLVCHKLLRRLTPFFLCAALIFFSLTLPSGWTVILLSGLAAGFFFGLWLVFFKGKEKESQPGLMARLVWLLAVVLGVCAGALDAVRRKSATLWQ